jgi:hypothetical protein
MVRNFHLILHFAPKNNGLHIMILPFEKPFRNEVEKHGWDVEWIVKG